MGVLMWPRGSCQGSKAGHRGRAKARSLEPHLVWEGQMEVSQGRRLRTGPRGEGEPGARVTHRLQEEKVPGGEDEATVKCSTGFQQDGF